MGGGRCLSCLSTPFLWCLPKETVSSRQRKALFLPWRLHHSRERCCLGWLYSSSPDLGRGWCVFFRREARMKVSSTFSKVAGCRGGALARAPQSAELSLCFIKRRRGSKGEPSPGVPPFIFAPCTCAPFTRAKAAAPYCPFHPISLLLRKETGWSPKETRLRVPPRGLFGPTRLSHGLEAPTSQPTASS